MISLLSQLDLLCCFHFFFSDYYLYICVFIVYIFTYSSPKLKERKRKIQVQTKIMTGLPFVGAVEEEISRATIEGVKREFLYMYKYKDNVNALKAKMEELGVQEEKIKRKIKSDEDDGKTIEDHALKWQLEVQKIKDKVKEFLRMYESKRSWTCLKVLRFPNLYSRFGIGREAVKKTEKVNGLIDTGIKLVDGEISYRPHVGYADLPSTTSFDNDYMSFESREDAYKKILEALNNKDAGFVVGIYGMAGAGKTTMMEQAWKQAKMDEIFDEVARADVSSEKLDVRKLQGLLASCLNLHLPSEENEEMRASLLVNRLTKKGNNILLLFDDVWEKLPLKKIGVPFGDGKSKGCKILLTSRKRDVCFENECKDPIEIKVLKEEEGWDLFKKNVGSFTINSLNDESLAKKVCDECACLPLVIAAVGKALKDKPEDSWKDALDQLRDSKLEKIDGIDPKVYTGLELSFNHLQKDAKSCLFLCSVFPEDAAIPIEELVTLVKGNRLIEDLDTLEKARTRVRSMVVALKNSSLLLPYNDNTEVKLHDIIRDVAKSVAAKDPTYAFLEKRCGTEWPNVNYKDRKLITISFDNINYFPSEDDLACPELHTLVLNLGTNLVDQQFPDKFFNGFSQLNVLVLNVRFNCHLPSSLQSLANLRMLSLHNADLNMSLIKELKNLEMLIILDDIEELSPELRELKRLRLLDIRANDCENMIMPRHLLSSLSNLEELYIPRGFRPRGKEEEGGGDPIFNPIHHELSKLTNLTTLHIHLPDVMFLPNEKICQKLLRYVIHISPDEKYYAYPIDEKRVLHLSGVAIQGRWSSLEILLESVEYMKLVSVNGFQTYFNNGEAFAKLANLSISKCHDLDHLGKLLQNYQQLPHHQPMSSFSKLTELRIDHSHGFKYLFCPSSARRLVQLRTLLIRGCLMMEEIIRPREQEEEEEEIIEFPNLTNMRLEHLPMLKSFYCKKINMCSATPDQNTSTFPVQSLFNDMVSFPVLKEFEMSHIENVTKIWEPQYRHTENSFSQLKILDVSSCNKLENVIPFAMLRRLQNMETLGVQHCSSLKCIVNGAKTTTTKDQEGSDSEIVFPVLKTLTLRKVPELDNFWCTRSMGSNTDQHQPSLFQKVSFPRLEKLHIMGVKLINWEQISLGDSAYQYLRSLRISESVFRPSWLVRLQNLEELWVVRISSEVSDLVELMGLNANLPRDHGIHHLLCFRGLKTLTVFNCNGLSTLFTCSLAKTNLQQLEYLSVKTCEKMSEIVRDENEGNKMKMVLATDGTNAHAHEILIVFPRLKRIELWDLWVLKSFCGSARYTFNMPSLEEVELRGCPLMINFTCRQLTTPKLRLEINWRAIECRDLNKYLETLLVGPDPEGEI